MWVFFLLTLIPCFVPTSWAFGTGDPEADFGVFNSIVDNVSFKLTDENFDESIEKGDHFVYFYHPGCKKCSIFGPEWKFFARDQKKKEEPSNATIAIMNLVENQKIARRFRIRSFPTILYFQDGHYYNYTDVGKYRPDFEEFMNDPDRGFLDKKRIPGGMTWDQDWYMYVTFWINNGPTLYPMETGAAAVGLFLLFSYCLCCGCKKSKTDSKDPAAEGEKAEGSPKKAKRE